MATVLKESTKNSPGIAIFSSNEFFYGIVGNSQKCKKRIKNLVEQKKWIFGIHINGYIPKKFYIPEFIYFILCPDKKSEKLNISQEIIPWTAELFVKTNEKDIFDLKKIWDILIVSRISIIKRFDLSLSIIEELINLKPEIKINIFATYSSFDKKEYDYVKSLSSRLRELLKANISLNLIDTGLFGMFPISNDDIIEFIAKSKSVLISSQLEGGPRVLGEAASLNVPIFVCSDIKSNLNPFFNQINITKIDIKPKIAAKEILRYFDKNNKLKSHSNIFNSNQSESNFKKDLISLLKKNNHKTDGNWHLYNLNMRLPGHSRRRNLQILYDQSLFLDWCDWIDVFEPKVIDEKLHLEEKRLKIKLKDKLVLKIYDFKNLVKKIFLKKT